MPSSSSCCDPLLPGLQQPSRRTLANGNELVSLSLPEAPLVCLDLWCRAGSVFETAEESGLAHFLEHMVFKGSTSLAAGEFDQRVEALGGSSNAATGFDDVHYHVLIPPRAAAEALELLLDLVLQPRLDAEAFAMERQVVLEELAQSEDQPEEVAVQRLLALACPDHAYGRPILGRREALLGHQSSAMAAFHQRLYGGGRCVLALSGALAPCEQGATDLEERAAASALASLPGLPQQEAPPPLTVVSGEERLALPRLEAARLLMAWGQPPARELRPLMGADLATSLLAEGRRSRLVARLREELQLVESIDLDLHAMECGSLALLEALCDPNDLPAVREAISAVWHELMDEPVGEAEWARVNRLVGNSIRFGMESAGAVAGLIGTGCLWGRHQRLEEPLEALASWDPESLRQEALASLDPRRAFVLEAVPA